MHALPHCITAPMYQWMDTRMHVHDISKIKWKENPNPTCEG